MNFANLTTSDLSNLSREELDNLISKASEIKEKSEKVSTYLDNPMGNNYNWVVSNSSVENVDLSKLDNEELITLSNKVKTELKNKGLTTNGNTKGNTEKKVDGRVGKSTRSLETDMEFPLTPKALGALVSEKKITNRMVSNVCGFSNPSNPNLGYWKKGVRKVPNKHTISILKLIFGNEVNINEINYNAINAKYA